MKIAISGITGRMGIAAAQAALTHPDVTAVIGSVREQHSEDARELLFRTVGNIDKLTVTKQIEQLLKADAIIDFTRPDHTIELAEMAAASRVALISGTTGLSDSQSRSLERCASSTPIVHSPNMSVCVTLMLSLVEHVASVLDQGYDVEIVEMHHRHKIDAPSGTALALGRAAADGRDARFETQAVLSREGETGPRKKGAIGFASLRGGQVIGDHTVIFAGEHERFELTHKSQSRQIYADGAMKAAFWATKQRPGLYSMLDVLGLN